MKLCASNEQFFLIRWFLKATSGTKPIIVSAWQFIFSWTNERNKEVPISMAIGNWELTHECGPKHSSMGTARLKQDNGTDEDDKKTAVSMEKSGHDQKKSRRPITS